MLAMAERIAVERGAVKMTMEVLSGNAPCDGPCTRAWVTRATSWTRHGQLRSSCKSCCPQLAS